MLLYVPMTLLLLTPIQLVNEKVLWEPATPYHLLRHHLKSVKRIDYNQIWLQTVLLSYVYKNALRKSDSLVPVPIVIFTTNIHMILDAKSSKRLQK